MTDHQCPATIYLGSELMRCYLVSGHPDTHYASSVATGGSISWTVR